jgi:hypothetical protein
MASPAIVSGRSSYATLWMDFKQELRRQVSECNAVAGDVCWIVRSKAESCDGITVVFTECADYHVDCSLDPALSYIECTCRGRFRPVSFRFSCAGGLLHDGKRSYTATEASAFILDQLVGRQEA